MKSLYLLSLLLTANPELAERCVISSLDDCLNGIAVAPEWAGSSAKRAIIKNAIRSIRPEVRSIAAKAQESGTQGHYQTHPTMSNVLALGDFERIVFVMCILERYSDCDSAGLLGCLPLEIRDARIRSIQHLAGDEPGEGAL